MTEDNFALEAAYTSAYTKYTEKLTASMRETNPIKKAKLKQEVVVLYKERVKLEERLGLRETTP
tara:strand:+ start:258 stop:449 length:192 start_codon:yes stop_codon:yes gene_type:complete